MIAILIHGKGIYTYVTAFTIVKQYFHLYVSHMVYLGKKLAQVFLKCTMSDLYSVQHSTLFECTVRCINVSIKQIGVLFINLFKFH